MRLKTSILLLALVLVTSCGEYQKLLKSTDYDLKKAKAKEYFDAGKFVKSSELLEQIIPRYRATEEAEDLIWMNGESYYGMKQYDMAGTVYKSVSYTHLRAHETVLDLVCRLLLEKKKKN